MFAKVFVSFWYSSILKCKKTWKPIPRSDKKLLYGFNSIGFVFNNLTFRLLEIFW